MLTSRHSTNRDLDLVPWILYFVFLYRTMYNLHENGILHCQWIEKEKSTLNNINCSDFWITQNVTHFNNFLNVIKLRLRDQSLQVWNNDASNSAKCLIYSI
jgi:hypothetical protein